MGMIEFMNHNVDKINIVEEVIKFNTLNILKKLFGLIGQTVFIQNALFSDGNNMNGLERAINEKKCDIIQYLLSFDEIQKEYETDKELIWRCVWRISYKSFYDESVALYLMEKLNLNEEKLRELQKFKCTKPENKPYWNMIIDDEAVNLLLNGKK